MVVEFILAASGLLSTTYGFGEKNCGDEVFNTKHINIALAQSFLPPGSSQALLNGEGGLALAQASFSQYRLARMIAAQLTGAEIKLAGKKCDGGITASGEKFEPFNEPSAAVAMPRNVRMRPKWVYLRVESGDCHMIRVNDKMNQRYVGKRGFDLSPSAQELLTGNAASKNWSGKVFVCGFTEAEAVASL